jgi:hypothetical protein
MGSPYILRKGVSSLSDLVGGNSAFSLLAAAGGNWFYFDPTHGTAGGDARTAKSATNSLVTAYDRCRDGYNDGVFFIGGATAWNPTAAFDWAKNYCHLVGLTADLPGLGQRARIVMQATPALTPAMTFSGSGNLIKNIQVYNEKATGAAGCVISSGSRCQFENVFCMSPVSPTAASYSLKETGAENLFVRCTVGQYTNARSAASYSLWLEGAATVSRDKFINCEFLSWGATHDHALVRVDADIVTVPWMTEFESCLFANNSGGGDTLLQAIDDNCTAAGHQILLMGDNRFAGVDVVADTLTYILTKSKFAGGLMAALTEA